MLGSTLIHFYSAWSLASLGHSVVTSSIVQTLYKKINDVQFANTTTVDVCTRPSCDGSVRSCAMACSLDPTCSSLNYDPAQKKCFKNVGDIYRFGSLLLTSSTTTHYIGKIQRDVTHDDWILVFRGQSGNSVNITSVYTSTQTSDNRMDTLNLSSISKLGDPSSAHYTSRWLNSWPANITQVKVELYEQGATVLSMLFNGAGSNSTNWFSHSRLIQSPFTDLTYPPLVFSLTSYQNKRRFVLTNGTNFFDCVQPAWLFVEDSVASGCAWWAGYKNLPIPRFLYSKGTTLTNFNTGAQGDAQVLAVFIKF